MAQRYGLELECFGLTVSEIETVFRTLNENGTDVLYGGHFGYHGSRVLGLRCAENGNGNLWVSERDGSVENTAGRGIAHEVISPVLEGEAGLRTAGIIMTALSRAGAKVNKSCGLHTTFGIYNSHARFRRMSSKKQARCLANLVDAYDYFQPLGLNSLVPPSRRPEDHRANSYMAQRMIRYPSGTQNMMGEHTNESAQIVVERGVGRGVLNISGFVSKGIIEFRQHNGTLNRWKIYNWSLLLQRMVQWAISDRHINHGKSLLDFPPTFEGMMDCFALGSDLRTGLTARKDSLEAVPTSWGESRMLHYEDAQLTALGVSPELV